MGKKRIILIHSIKGGCGKTTISLALSEYFKNEMKTCYLDADIVGYGTSKLFDNISSKKSFTDYLLINPFENKNFFISDFKDAKYDLFDDYIIDNNGLTIIQSSVIKEKSEKAIRVTNDLFLQDEIKYKIYVLIEKLFIYKEIDTIIIDTTPGNQGLTRILKEIVSELNVAHENRSIFKKEILNDIDLKVQELYITTNHFAHIASLIVEDFTNNNTQVVLNQIPIGFDFIDIPNKNSLISDFGEIRTAFDKSDPKGIKGINEFFESIIGPNEIDDDVKEAYKRYCIVNSEDYKIELLGKSNLSINNIHIIPEVSSLRKDSANFLFEEDSFNKDTFSNSIIHEIQSGHLKLLCDSIQNLIQEEII